MSVIDFMIKLAKDLPNSNITHSSEIEEKIVNAIEQNDKKMLQILIADKTNYTNERTVTNY